VRTGPLAGKSFILYRSPTSLGSSPECDIYLFKDPDVDPRHAVVHRVGNAFEIEDTSERRSVRVNGEEVKRSPLSSGDRVMIGETVLEFEVRARRVVAEAVALEQR
jgi:pSer/pThr/pTyr-binding forkhead associated (FHA) protein